LAREVPARALQDAEADTQKASQLPVPKRLVFLQVHKMASRSVSEALHRMGLPKGSVVILPELQTLVPKLRCRKLGRHNAFVIAAIRGPCDWYVSNWKYKCQGELTPQGGGGDKLRRWCGGRRKGWLHNVTAFQSYLTSGSMWHMSRLMYDVYVGPHIKASHRTLPWNCSGDPARPFSQVLASCRPQWERVQPVTFSPTAVDCWVHLTSMEADLQVCLQRWANISGVDPAAVLKREAAPHIHKIKGLPCSAYFTPELEAALMQLDKPIFEFFGYPTCCGMPRSR